MTASKKFRATVSPESENDRSLQLSNTCEENTIEVKSNVFLKLVICTLENMLLFLIDSSLPLLFISPFSSHSENSKLNLAYPCQLFMFFVRVQRCSYIRDIFRAVYSPFSL